jgi:enterochelin esterase family protein
MNRTHCHRLRSLQQQLLQHADSPLQPDVVGALEEDGPPDGGVADAFVGPDYSPAPEISGAAAVAHGTVTALTMKSTASKIYPGVDRKEPVVGADLELYDARFRGLGCSLESFGQPEFDNDGWVGHGHGEEHHGHPMNADASTPDLFKPGVQPYERSVVVYTPVGLDPSDPAPFILVNDGGGYVENMVPTLDSLIAAGRVPPNLCALFVDSGGSDAQGSQRGLEYDTVDGTFADFCETEVKPFVESTCGITLTSDPEGRAAMGGSSGGCAAFTMAWFRPDLFRKVLTYSGTYVNQQ